MRKRQHTLDKTPRGHVDICITITLYDGDCSNFNLDCKLSMKLGKEIKQNPSDLKHNHAQEKSYL